MAPDHLRNVIGFAGLAASLVTLVTATPSLAQGLPINSVMGAAPLAIALGAAGFALIATAIVRRLLRDSQAARRRSATQVAALRARVDEYEALLSGGREIVVLWADTGEGPRFLGQASSLLPVGRRPEAIL